MSKLRVVRDNTARISLIGDTAEERALLPYAETVCQSAAFYKLLHELKARDEASLPKALKAIATK